MSKAADIRAAIVAKLATVSGIGKVHGFERYTDRPEKFKDFYTATVGGKTMLRGWYVRRISKREISETIGIVTCVTNWRIVGYHGLEDGAASEEAFDELIEAACDAFRADATLGGIVADLCDLTASQNSTPYGLQVEDFAPVLFAGALSHRAQLALTTTHKLHF